MEPWQSWTAVAVLAAGAYYYYQQADSKKAKAGKGVQATRWRDTAQSNGNTSAFNDLVSSEAGNAAERKNRRKPTKKNKLEPTSVAPPQLVQTADEPEETVDEDWAARLAGNRKGTNLAAPSSRPEARSRTVKQGALRADASGASSTGADADDDLSPAMSPVVDSAPLASGNDVSDMLEAPAAGPSVLRVTEPLNPAKSKQHAPKAPATPKETKKQRQNRRKVEEQRAEREQAEKERRTLMEKQRRTAREARGEPARNGVQPAKAPTSNAWTTVGSKPVSTQELTGTTNNQLLDTFEKDSTTSSNNQASSVASVPTPGTNWGDLPSEEEQVRMAIEDSAWNTVSHGKRGKKKTSAGVEDGSSHNNGAATSSNDAHSTAQTVKPATTVSAPKNTAPSYSTRYDNLASFPGGSEWDVV